MKITQAPQKIDTENLPHVAIQFVSLATSNGSTYAQPLYRVFQSADEAIASVSDYLTPPRSIKGDIRSPMEAAVMVYPSPVFDCPEEMDILTVKDTHSSATQEWQKNLNRNPVFAAALTGPDGSRFAGWSEELESALRTGSQWEKRTGHHSA